MNKGCLVNLVLVAVVVTLLGILAFFVRIRPVVDSVAVLKTAGNCGATVEKLLQAKRGVASTEVDTAAGRVIVGYDSKMIKPEEMAAASSAAGYPRVVEETMSVQQYRAMTGRNPGDVLTAKAGCGCIAGK